MTKLDRLMSRQSRLLNELTRQCQLIGAFSPETSSSMMLCRKDALEKLWAEIEYNSNTLESLSNWVGSEEFNQNLSNAHDQYLAALTQLMDLIPPDAANVLRDSLNFGRQPFDQHQRGANGGDDLENQTTDQTENPNLESTGIPEIRTSPNIPVNIKLPPLRITVFSGNKIDWPEFKALCETTFGAITNECTRFQYLKGHLAEEPARLIRHLPITNGSYARAWEILVKRYDNERIIINANLKRLMELPVLQTESAQALKLMLDVTNECLAAVNSYDIVTANWYPIMIFLLSTKLDTNSIKHWEEKIQGQKTIPRLQTFLDFLEMRVNILETTFESRPGYHPKISQDKGKRVFFGVNKPTKCTFCGESHRAFTCPKLLSETVETRLRLIDDKKLCRNCLYHHKTEECKSSYSCRLCDQRHNSILHTETNLHIQGSPDDGEAEDPDELQAMEMERIICAHVQPPGRNTCSVLPTAMIRIKHKNRAILVRALIDQGSTADLVSKRTVEALGLPQWDVDLPITGVGGKETIRISKGTHFDISPYYTNSTSLGVTAYVLPYITTLKTEKPNRDKWPHLKGLQLADPKNDSNGRIDLLLGNGTLSEMLLDGIIRGKPGQPLGQKTSFGWIISGKLGDGTTSNLPVFSLIISDQSLSSVLQKFWESEEIPKMNKFTPEEQLAEDTFVKTTKRGKDGRFVVKLPFKSDPKISLGNSFRIATRRYQMLQRRFRANPGFCGLYNKCIDEYLELGHMELADDTKPGNYLPHHPVVKESSTTTRIRPVFDASCKTENGNSLNSQLLVGPTIQPDLFSLLIQWRKNRYAFTGDIEKMYRQVWVRPEDSEYQRILYQPTGSGKILSYRLKTVTFGTGIAPFLAIRALHQVGEDIKTSRPELAYKIQNQFYVDDHVDSTHSIGEAKEAINAISAVLADYGFNLRKWKANDPAITNHLPISDREEGADEFATFKTLGVQWQSSTDDFIFLPTELTADTSDWTKRKILSDIAKLFDPLGWLAPCTVLAKLFMQSLWLLPLDWDSDLPENVITEWLRIRDQFMTSCSVKIPRWLGIKSEVANISLQGFADASEKSYACVVYLRIEQLDGKINCGLIAAKTKVAPVKNVSLPRLELNAALLLAQLMIKVRTALQIGNIESNAWTDSTIVLCWLAGLPNRWKTYVANRVSEIQGLVPSHDWKHVESSVNPADCASRGLERHQLEKFDLWWQGPGFLTQPKNMWPKKAFGFETTMEERKPKPIFHINIDKPDESIFERFSEYSFMIRVFRTCLKWRQKIKSGELPTFEDIEIRLCRIVQSTVFSTEIACLGKTDQSIPRGSSIKSLDPQLHDGVLRVGGRIQRSMLSFSERHPIILPPKHRFTKLLIRYEHYRTMHGGVSITLQKIRQRFWIIHGKIAVNSGIHQCVTCFRFSKKFVAQKMGNLPTYRLHQALPFTFTGVDYAGYFDIKSSARKNAPFIKGYIAVFLCLTTRALHLELVSNLSTIQFIKAFKRFISRRGIPREMHSDNGTNFIGAAREIHDMMAQTLRQADSGLRALLSENHIKWSNIPARAPHFGGWESGVKLVKHHLKRVLGNIRLTFEDFNTVIIEIEAIVNSRPLWAIPTQTGEYEALTPGHFLIFRALNTLPEPITLDIPLNRLNQYQYLCRLTSDFWRLWSREYLHQLQARKKWQDIKPNLRPNQIVLVAEDIEYPSQWALGKIITPISGEDGLVRVADILCRGKIIRRSIHKLCLLPINDNKTIEPTAQPGENGEIRGEKYN